MLMLAFTVGLAFGQTPTETLEQTIEKANQGDTKAMIRMGSYYQTGKNGVEKDIEKALSWYKKAVEKGDARAAILIGTMYSLGRDVTKDENEALKWFNKAQELGDKTGMAATMIEMSKRKKEQTERTQEMAAQEMAAAQERAKRLAYTAADVSKMSPEERMLALKKVVMKERLDQAAFSISKCYANGENYLKTKDNIDVTISEPDNEKTKIFAGCPFEHNNDSALVWCKRCVEYGNLSQNYYIGAEYQVKKYGRIVSYEQGKLLMDYKDERVKVKKILDKHKKKYGVNFYNQLCVKGNIVKGMPLSMIVEYADDINALDRVANVLVIRFSVKEYQPTTQDIMQGGRNVRVYRLFGRSDFGQDYPYYKLLCVNGKVVKEFKYRNDYLSLADYRQDEINTLENSLKMGIVVQN